jgi:arylsulfatase A-like enzyme
MRRGSLRSDSTAAYVRGELAPGGTRDRAGRGVLWVHYYDPHYAYEPHPEVPSFAPSSRGDRVALYDGELRFTDLHIGRLLDELRAHKLYDKTIIVVTGDHGEGFGEHGIELHGYHLYAAQTRVPLIIRVPGMPPRRAATPTSYPPWSTSPAAPRART